MKSFFYVFLIGLLTFTGACSSDNKLEESSTPKGIYFPPNNSSSWETVSSEELGWNLEKESALIDLLEHSDTKAFVILKNGRIALEKYVGLNNKNTKLPWYSAAKTLVASTVGIAQDENLLSINDPTSQYLGEGWTSATTQQEQAISIRNQLTMTTGLDYSVANTSCTDPACLQYLNEPGSFWFYHNATYTLLHGMIAEATGRSFNDYFDEKISNKIGMNGKFTSFNYLKIYSGTARSLARFGLLNLNHGKWKEDQIIPKEYAIEMTTTSQNLNPAYGYFWWLNGKNSFKIPGNIESYQGKLIPSAPDDLYAGLGANDQKLYVVPSEKLVIVRLGKSADEDLAGPSSFDEELWQKLNAYLNL